MNRWMIYINHHASVFRWFSQHLHYLLLLSIRNIIINSSFDSFHSFARQAHSQLPSENLNVNSSSKNKTLPSYFEKKNNVEKSKVESYQFMFWSLLYKYSWQTMKRGKQIWYSKKLHKTQTEKKNLVTKWM